VNERFDLASHTIILESPRRLTVTSAWTEHIPFAMLLVDLVRPGMIVELGTHAGDSYCAFCQAVQTLEVQARCFAVDTWKGDPHAGEYGPEVLDDLRGHHDYQYGRFSSLIQATFDEAVRQFEDGSIDILHIDGYHTYEAVRHDFATWLPKVSPRGLVLLHDTNVRTEGFGIWRFWAEVSQRYPHFEFTHGHGLGVLSVGAEEPPALRAFRESFAADGWIPTLFFDLGQRLSWQTDSKRAWVAAQEAVLRKDADITELQGGIRRQQEALVAKDQTLAAQQAALDEKDAGLSAHEAISSSGIAPLRRGRRQSPSATPSLWQATPSSPPCRGSLTGSANAPATGRSRRRFATWTGLPPGPPGAGRWSWRAPSWPASCCRKGPEASRGGFPASGGGGRNS
jgi:hypothetical protein